MRLDFGGGAGDRPAGFTTVDVVGGEIEWDLSRFPYPFEGDSIEIIHCSHTLEHLRKEDAKRLLREAYRILQPGGILTLAVPDMDFFIDRHLSEDWTGVPDHIEKDLNYCAAGGKFPADDPWRHKYMFCWESLAYLLQEAGFIEVERHGHGDSKYQHLWPGAYNPGWAICTLYVDARKPANPLPGHLLDRQGRAAMTRWEGEQYAVRQGPGVPTNPKVSMVVSAYFRDRQILPTLACFLAQTHQNFEVLVVHDGPGDGRVRETVALFGDDRLRYLELPERAADWGNSAKAWGSQQATGDWIGHSNDDNYYAPVYFEAMLSALVGTDAQFAFCNMVHSHQGWAPFETALLPGWIDGGGWICRADVVRATTWPIDTTDDYADGHYAQALAARSKVVKVPATLFVHN
jgi:predicted SAM-dependent methyltransferase